MVFEELDVYSDEYMAQNQPTDLIQDRLRDCLEKGNNKAVQMSTLSVTPTH